MSSTIYIYNIVLSHSPFLSHITWGICNNQTLLDFHWKAYIWAKIRINEINLILVFENAFDFEQYMKISQVQQASPQENSQINWANLNGCPPYTEIFSKRRKIYSFCVEDMRILT